VAVTVALIAIALIIATFGAFLFSYYYPH